MTTNEAFTFLGDWSGQLVATAVHAGHDLREETAALMALEEADRLREEDPFTDEIGSLAPAHVVVNRSRFEVDLNREREKAVYRRPEDAWGLEMWTQDPLPDDVVARSLEVYDSFYDALGQRLDELAARGPFVVYDVHSYNHRRNGPDVPAEPVAENPEVNLGTGTVDKDKFGGVVDAFFDTMGKQLVGGHPLDVRENVKFEGRALSWFVHDRYPGVGCCLALEFRKSFMDEWTGEPFPDRISELQQALAATHKPVLEALREL